MSLSNIAKIVSAIRCMNLGTKSLQLATPCLTSCQWNRSLSSRTNPTDNIVKKAKGPKKPLTFGYSGDLITQNALDLTQPREPFNRSKELESAPDTVKRLFSLDFAEGEGRLEYRLKVMSERIDEQLGPDADDEKEIALLTVRVRNLIPHCLQIKKDKVTKSILIDMIQKRKSKLKDLQKKDFERFVWLLNDLRIKYVPYPYPYAKTISPRGAQMIEAEEKAAVLISSKKIALKEELRKEREEFEVYKEATLAQMKHDVSEFNLNEDEIWEAVYHDLNSSETENKKARDYY